VGSSTPRCGWWNRFYSEQRNGQGPVRLLLKQLAGLEIYPLGSPAVRQLMCSRTAGASQRRSNQQIYR